MKLEFREIPVAGDGNCLFHSLGKAFDKNQQQLRNMFSAYIVKNRKKKINGMELEEWVKLEKDMPLIKYAEVMKRSGVWGGSLEITVAHWIYKTNIFVMGRNGNNYKILSSYVYGNKARNIFVTYNGVHYNYLKVVKNLSGIKT